MESKSKRRSEAKELLVGLLMTRVILVSVLVAYLVSSSAAAHQQQEEGQQETAHQFKHNENIPTKASIKNATLINQRPETNLAATTIKSIVLSGEQHLFSTSPASTTALSAAVTGNETAQTTPPSKEQIALKSGRQSARPKAPLQQEKKGADRQSKAKSANGQRQQPERELIDQMSTSQSVSFAEPLMASSNQQEQQTHFQQQQQQQQQQPQKQQQQQQQKGSQSTGSGGNRWTHFGARLRPLVGDHHSASSKPLAAFEMSSSSQNQNQKSQAPASNTLHHVAPLSGNQVNENEDADDDLDDDQDNEALLYKMMQQQGFLSGSIWQQKPQSEAQSVALAGSAPIRQADSNGLSQSLTDGAGDGRTNSKKIIKLLKSYSHIHQVDDSDDQIRGSYIRPLSSARRPTVSNENGNNWQTNGYNRNSQPETRSRQQHIFVSQQPLSRAHSNPNVRQQQPAEHQYPQPEHGYPQQGNPDAGQEDPNGGPPPEEDEFECPNNGIFADEPSGCQSYHVCQSGAQVQQKFQCPMGTLFNNIILTCDFAHNVQCKGKNSNAGPNQAQTNVEEQQNEPIYRQPQAHQAQQVPRASVQLGQPSYAHWQQQQPRVLKIGQQQQHQQPSLAQVQAVSPYPHPQPPAANSNSNDDDDSDDEPLQPLVPAVLPAQATPPPPQQQLQPAGQHYQQQRRPQYLQSANNGAYDGDSAASPVFASRDEPRSTESSVQSAVSSGLNPLNDPHSFNLVINHLTTPTSASSTAAAATANRQKQQDSSRKAPKSKLQAASEPQYKKQAENKQPLVASHQRLQIQSQYQNQVSPQQRQAAAPVYNRQPVYSNQQRYQQATQPKVVHVDARAPLVDLTNDGRQGVSSEALNDGLLLVVRHGPAGAASGKQAAGRGQAYALEPSAVRPNSPVDAQLFPNVQRVLAASQPAVSHQAAPASHYHAQQLHDSSNNNQQQTSRVSPPLAPMEPPKPNLAPAQQQADSLQLVASSSSNSAAALTASKKPVASGGHQDKLTANKRAKRLKAHPTPTAKQTEAKGPTGNQKQQQQQQQRSDNTNKRQTS